MGYNPDTVNGSISAAGTAPFLPLPHYSHGAGSATQSDADLVNGLAPNGPNGRNGLHE